MDNKDDSVGAVTHQLEDVQITVAEEITTLPAPVVQEMGSFKY